MGSYVPFDHIAGADLHIDATYGSLGSLIAGDPLQTMFKCGNQGGFRQKRDRITKRLNLVVLFSSLADPDWPDRLDEQEGVFTYYGDNKKPGDLHRTKRNGNLILARETFGPLISGQPDRAAVPPFFVFTRAPEGRDVVFRGLAVPGAPGIATMDQLVAVWKSKDGERFQNYKAHFTILDEAVVSRAWIDDLLAGRQITENTPKSWIEWVLTGKYRALRAEPTVSYRTKADQLPLSAREDDILREVYSFYSQRPTDFEPCAAELFRLVDGNVIDFEVTRPWRDGGRDAVGRYRIGTSADPVKVDFALEAKCYEPGRSSVGVKEMSRLISRLQHRQFGVMVTTSYVHKQAYEEVTDDGHPVLILAGRDITEALTRSGYGSAKAVESWLRSIA